MEKKNMVLLTVIAVATLLVAVVGATFAYFTATSATDSRGEGANGTTQFTTAKVADSTTLNVIQGVAGSFTTTDIFPGHQEVAGLSVKITGQAGSYTIPFLYSVETNTISEKGGTVNYYLYSADSALTVDMGCLIETSNTGSEVHYSEGCSFKNAEANKTSPSLDSAKGNKSANTTQVSSLKLVDHGKLVGGAQSIQMDDEITISESDATKYYYFVLEYVNEDKKQNDSEGQDQSNTTLKGTITVAGAKEAGD